MPGEPVSAEKWANFGTRNVNICQHMTYRENRQKLVRVLALGIY